MNPASLNEVHLTFQCHSVDPWVLEWEVQQLGFRVWSFKRVQDQSNKPQTLNPPSHPVVSPMYRPCTSKVSGTAHSRTSGTRRIPVKCLGLNHRDPLRGFGKKGGRLGGPFNAHNKDFIRLLPPGRVPMTESLAATWGLK